MQNVILLGQGNNIVSVPDDPWRAAVQALPARMKARLAFMTPTHHLIRDFVVRELPRHNGRPIQPTAMARSLGLPEQEVVRVLAELERKLFFLVRNKRGEVSWAFPVTSEETPHRLRFSTGERVFGA